MVVWWTTCWIVCLFVLYFPPVPWPPGECRRDSPEGRAMALSVPVQLPVLPPRGPHSRSPAAPRFVPFPWWILPSCFLTHHVLLAPHPISPPLCALVPVVVSLWLFIGHSPPPSSFCEGKRHQSGTEDGVRGLSGPWDWAVSLAPAALRLGEKAVVVVWFSFIFVECVFLWSGLWSGLIFVY